MSETTVLGIIAGGGDLPVRIIEHCKQIGRPFFVLSFAENKDLNVTPDAVVRFGEIGKALEHLHGADVADIVMAGPVKRPSLLTLRPDAEGAKLLARLGKVFFSGDDALLSTLVGYMEEQGFNIVGADELIGGLLVPEGTLGKIVPDAKQLDDIRIGVEAAKELGRRDAGQAVIVRGGEVIARENADGTDAMMMGGDMRGGVLVKVKKPGQEKRVDLPTIGVATIENAHKAGLAGVAVEAGGSLMLDDKNVASKADALGLFVIGVAP